MSWLSLRTVEQLPCSMSEVVLQWRCKDLDSLCNALFL